LRGGCNLWSRMRDYRERHIGRKAPEGWACLDTVGRRKEEGGSDVDELEFERSGGIVGYRSIVGYNLIVGEKVGNLGAGYVIVGVIILLKDGFRMESSVERPSGR